MLNKIGFLSLDNTKIRGEGSIYDPSYYGAETIDIEVHEATTSNVVKNPMSLAGNYRSAANFLLEEGANFVASNCGLSMTLQSEVQQATKLPTVMSSLILLPLLYRVFGSHIGVLAYDSRPLDDKKLREECGWLDDMDISVAAVNHFDSWKMLEQQNEHKIDAPKMWMDLKKVINKMVQEEPLSAILIECTAMLPFRDRIQDIAKVPVFDVVDLIQFLQRGPKKL